MPDGWARVPLGEVAALDIDRVPVEAGRKYPVAGVLNAGQGVFARDVIDGSETNYPALNRLHTGKLVMRKLTAWEGPITCVPEEFDGYFVSAEFPTFTLGDGLLPAYMTLVCQQPDFWEAMNDRSTGSVQRRKRVSPSQLLAIPVDIPPPAEQRRIVDLIEAANGVGAAARRMHESLQRAHATVREHAVAQVADLLPLRDLIEGIEAGRSPKGEDRTPKDGEAAVLKVSAVRPGWFEKEQVKVVEDTSIFPPHARVKDGDLLITRANTQELVGAVCIVDEAPPNTYLCDKTLRIVPREADVRADYLCEVLQTSESRRQLSGAGTGTSGSMKNISQADIRSVRIPLFDLAEQARLASVLEAFRTAEQRVGRQRAATATLRRSLLQDLLSGEQPLPPSYDRFLDDAA